MRLLWWTIISQVFLCYELSAATDCQDPEPNTCGFYRACLETHQQCGPEGYALGYGDKYCRRFKAGKISLPVGKCGARSPCLAFRWSL